MTDGSKRMEVLRYEIKFLTPAFLGNSSQRGQWRTPPFKALMRQWWRVVWFAQNASSLRDDQIIPEMRKREGQIFGCADNEGAKKSEIRMRLDNWDDGRFPPVWSQGNRQPNYLLYAGYGLQRIANGTERKAIGPNESNALVIATPTSFLSDICMTLSLIHHYGTIGGRSRNGWGSLELRLEENEICNPLLEEIFQPFSRALERQWPHAIGKDKTAPLVWNTKEPFEDWKGMMGEFGRIRKEIIRKEHKASRGEGRMPNNIRFKARQEMGSSDQLRGVVFHMPCTTPNAEKHHRTRQDLWGDIHKVFDEQLERVSE